MWPKRKWWAEAMAVSAGTFDSTAERGRSSRPYVKWSSLILVGERVVKRFALKALIFEGPSMPLAEFP